MNYPKTWWLKTTHIYYFTEMQGIWVLCFKDSHKAAIKVLARDEISSESSTGMDRLPSLNSSSWPLVSYWTEVLSSALAFG